MLIDYFVAIKITKEEPFKHPLSLKLIMDGQGNPTKLPIKKPYGNDFLEWNDLSGLNMYIFKVLSNEITLNVNLFI